MMKVSCFLIVLALSISFMACEGPMEEPTAQPLLKGYHITSIAFDDLGNTWLGTLNQGLVKFDGQTVTVYPEISGMVRAIKIDSKNQVYIAADGLVKFDGEVFTRFDDIEGNVMALDIDSKDRVWFAMGGFNHGGLGRLDGEALSFYTPDNSPLPAHWVSAVKVGRDDEVWLSAQSSVGNIHLAKITEEDWELFDANNLGFSPYNITNLENNSQGQLIGGIDYSLSSTYDTTRPSLFTFNEREGRQITSSKPLSVNQIFVDRSDRIWCAGSAGYALYENENWTYDEETFKEISVFAIAQAPDGAIWIGTGDGVFLLMV